MIRQLEDGLIQIRGWFVNSYVLIEGKEATIIDGGFVGDIAQIERALRSNGLDWPNVKVLLMTHGHLDHAFNAEKIRRLSGATIYGHPADRLHFLGEYCYRGMALGCDLLERLGRLVFGYDQVTVDREIADGDELDICAGIRVLHLPGHTRGHCGFYSHKHKILFSGDLFANWLWDMLPWPWLNSCPELFPDSIKKVVALNPDGILGNHCGLADPQRQQQRFFAALGKRYAD